MKYNVCLEENDYFLQVNSKSLSNFYERIFIQIYMYVLFIRASLL